MAKTIYATTQSEANSQLKQWVHEVDTSQYTNRGKLTVGQYINYYLNDLGNI